MLKHPPRHSLFSPFSFSLFLPPAAVELEARNGPFLCMDSNASFGSTQTKTGRFCTLFSFVAEREGFVLEFCKTSDWIYMLCFAKFFGHRSKTTHCVVFSLRSNPIVFSAQRKKHRFCGAFPLWRRERDSNPRNGISVHTISNRAP